MFSRTSFLALLFVGLISLLPREAIADPLPPWDGGIDTPQVGWGGGWGSTISCTPLPGGTNIIDLNSIDQSAMVQCIVTESTGPTPSATCQLHVNYSNLTLV